MTGGSKRKKKGGARGGARARPPALGNDPFERGAATREASADLSAGAAERPGSPPVAAAAGSPPVPPPSSPPSPTPAALGIAKAAEGAHAKLADIERRVDGAIDGLEARLQELASGQTVAGVQTELREALGGLLPAVRARLSTALDLVRLLEPPERLDRFGRDPRFAERLEPLIELLYAGWWRVQVHDVVRVPAAGPAIVVANHAGAVPWDALVVRHALRRDHPAQRDVRPLLEDRECDLPVFGAAAVRYGAVRASVEAAERLLAAGDVIAVFPEGSAVSRKGWRDRYRIQRFGRGGFAKVALRARAPIVPCAIVGSEEASPGSPAAWLAERLGLPPVATSSALRVAAAALLPLPSRWTIRFGEPIEVLGHEAAAAEDPAVVNALVERVRATIQAMLDEGLASRSSVFL
jgi:1-acyl-sn-glycerol-3-phosphate acyltransferase